MKPRALRAFLAVEMGPPIKEAYARLHASWREKHRGLRWVEPGNLHLTLRFFGSLPGDRLDALRARVEEVARGARPFRLTLGPAGCFGPRRSPRVVWLGIGAGAEDLASLAPGLEDAAAALGFARETRPWTAHLTLARGRERGPSAGWEEDIASSGLAGLGEDVDRVSFFESRTGPAGAVHSLLWEAPLGGARGGP